MTDLEDFLNEPFGAPLTPPNPAAPGPRTCRRHQWGVPLMDQGASPSCVRCGRLYNFERSRRGTNNKKRGLSIQREVAEAADMDHVPGNRSEDARDSGFYAEIKSGPAWYSTRVEGELDNLPTDTGRRPVFMAASTPGPGRGRRRVYATVTLGDLLALIGPHAQVSMWLPEWVELKRSAGVTRR